MSSWAWGMLSLVVGFFVAALGDLFSEEIRGWLDLVPSAILRIAAAQLDPVQRETVYEDEWLPELRYVLRGAEARPISRLVRGISFSIGLLISARMIRRHLNRAPAARATERSSSHQLYLGGNAPLPRQIVLALFTVALEGVACYFAAEGFGGTMTATIIWAILFVAVLAAGELALDRYRRRRSRKRRILALMLGVFVATLGVLRFSFLLVTESGLLAAAVGAAIFTAATAGFLLLGDRTLATAESPQAWRDRRLARAGKSVHRL